MPPAFVLSQDQTLHKIYFRVLSSFTYLLALFPFPKKLFELSESALSVSLIVFSLSSGLFALFNCLIFKELGCLATAFIYYHIIISLSTPFFELFSNSFLVLQKRRRWLLFYHFLSPLSTRFFLNLIYTQRNKRQGNRIGISYNSLVLTIRNYAIGISPYPLFVVDLVL